MNDGGAAAKVRLSPELLDDAAEAFAWYEAQGEGLGRAFVRAVFAAVSRAARQPQLAREVMLAFGASGFAATRTSLYYLVEAGEIVSYLLFHGARDSKALRRTLWDRRSVL